MNMEVVNTPYECHVQLRSNWRMTLKGLRTYFAFLFKNIDIQVLFNMCTFNETDVVISLHCVSCYKIVIIDTSNMQNLISVLLLLFDSSHALQNIIWAVWHGFKDYFLTLWSMYLSFVMRYLSKHTLWIVLHISRLIFRCFQVILIHLSLITFQHLNCGDEISFFLPYKYV